MRAASRLKTLSRCSLLTSTVYQTTSPPGAVNVNDPVKTPPNCGQMDSVYSASCLAGTVRPGLPVTPGRSLSTVYSRSLVFCCVRPGGKISARSKVPQDRRGSGIHHLVGMKSKMWEVNCDGID